MSSVIQAPTEPANLPGPQVKSKWGDPMSATDYPVRSQRGNPTWELALLFPAQGEWTEEEYLALNTNWLIELSDGCLEFLPVPTLFHQFIVVYLFRLLDDFVQAQHRGRVLVAPLPVRLWPGKMREPDIVFLRTDRLPMNLHTQPRGADLVMEVVSPGDESRNRDLETKREEYAEAGIDEYWIVDPEREHITVLTRENHTYREHGLFALGQQASSVLLSGFSVDVAAVFASSQANP